MNQGIVIDGNKVHLSDEIKNIIKELTIKDNFVFDEYLKNIDDNERYYEDISYLIDHIINSAIGISELNLNEKRNNNFDPDLQSKLEELCKEFKLFYQKYEKNFMGHISPEDVLNEYEMNGKLDELEKIIKQAYEIETTQKTIYLLRDLNNYKDDCIKNMQYFLDEKTIEQFNVEYSKALKEKDIPRLKELLNIVNNMIEKEWTKFLQNPIMTDEEFCFIGHSTNATKFDGDFRDRLVSCSLYNQDVNDTYKSSYGFMFAPSNIIGAYTNDMYIVNKSRFNDSACQFSSFPKMYHPKRMLEECKQLKKKNPDEKIYNEVVIEGFNPIGIFCFTTGPKEFDYNYERALQLKQNFPNLQIKTFDKYKTNKSDKNKLAFINNVHKKSGRDFLIDENNLEKYNYFFEKYSKIENNCTAEEVIALYQKNQDLIVNYKDPEELFTKYNEEEIKYILKYNYRFNIENILKGNIKPYSLTKLSEFYNYRNELNKYYPGLGKLIVLVNKINIDENIINEINRLGPITIDSINQLLSSKFLSGLEQEKASSEERLKALKNNYEQMSMAYEKEQQNKQKYDYYIGINSWKLKYIERDYIELSRDINENSVQGQNIIMKSKNCERQLQMLQKQKHDIEPREYEDTYYNNQINEFEKQNEQLSKHPFINRKKIKSINKEIKYLKSELEIQIRNFKINKDQVLHKIDSRISTLKLEIEYSQKELEYIGYKSFEYQNEMNNIIDELKNEFNANTFAEAQKLIDESEEFIENYDSSELIHLEFELKKIINNIKNEEANVKELEEQIDEVKVR